MRKNAIPLQEMVKSAVSSHVICRFGPSKLPDAQVLATILKFGTTSANRAIGMLFEFDQVEPAERYSAERSLHQVNFSCFAPSAKQVSVVGDFNYWDPDANPMHSMPDGGWVLTLPLHHGHHQYYFLIDGCPTLDPRSSGTVENERGEPASLIAVS